MMLYEERQIGSNEKRNKYLLYIVNIKTFFKKSCMSFNVQKSDFSKCKNSRLLVRERKLPIFLKNWNIVCIDT